MTQPVMQLVITEIDDSVPGVRTLRLAHPEGRALPSYPPGSHVVLQCGDVANAYSLTGDGVSPMRYVVSVLLCPNGSGGSRWIHDEVRIGETIDVSAPRSAFAAVHKARRHLLIAAGIGITPMMSHLYSAKRWGADARLLYIHRAGRGAYLDEIEQLGMPARICTDRDRFHSELTAALISQPIGTHLYVCGPGPFMDDVIAQAGELGWPPSRIHSERFGVDALDAGEPFEVELAGTGQTLTVPSGVSLLEALEKNGQNVPNLCRQGVCGECRIPVARGDILHRDTYLSDDEKQAGDALMACVSRAAGERLELAL